MKFGKELSAQMVQEWQEAYMDYNQLKTLLKEIQRFRQRIKPAVATSLNRKMTMYRAFSGLTRRYSNLMSPTTTKGRGRDEEGGEEQVILVNSSEEGGGSYATKFLMSSDEGGEYELVFFRRLDEEFNKVNKFYKEKVQEVLKEAASLNKQMEAFIAFRVKVNIEKLNFTTNLPTHPHQTSIIMPTTNEGRAQMEIIHEVEMSSEDVSEAEAAKPENSHGRRSNQPAPLEILNHVRFTNAKETPRSTLKSILMDSKHKELMFSKEELQKIQNQLKRAFVEFYQKLHLLKSYSFLNLLAFSKIMKKYDKTTSRSASKSYLNMVDSSYLGSSDEITRLMERVEATFIKHFSNSNRRKGIRTLRPTARRERHRITFLLGLFSGCALALTVALIVLTRARNIYNHEGSTLYMNTMFPLYSVFGFIVLHMLMYAANIYFWKRYRVNYPFIFGFKRGTELGYKEVSLLGTGLAVLALASVLSNLDMELDPRTQNYKTLTELVPLGLVVLVLLITLCPFNIIYRSSRFFLLRCAFHCLCAPLYKVTLPDFFLADQLTSQVQAIRGLEFYICYYGWGDYRRRDNNCEANTTFRTFAFIVAVIPYWARFLQCLRRLFEERDAMQGYNGLKYFATIIAVCMRIAYSLDRGMGWKVMAATTSAIAALVSTYWDIVIDWGLLQQHSKNRWLRDKLLISHTSVYFIAIVLNILLRFAWVQTVLDFQIDFLHQRALIAIVACLEIIRRGIWNFFRLENEHLNNVGKYRAFKSVPLPFNYDEDEDKDE